MLHRAAFFGLSIVILLSSSASVFAHPGHGSDFQDGWQHPLMGLDHVLAMVAVGLLASRIGGRMVWLLPAAFLGSVVLGGVAASAGLPLPGVEFGIIASVLVLGMLVAAARLTPQRVAVILVTLFAFFHGHAHAAETLATGTFGSYASGFLLSTAGLLTASVIGGSSLLRFQRAAVVRLAGGMIAAVGLLMLAGMI